MSRLPGSTLATPVRRKVLTPSAELLSCGLPAPGSLVDHRDVDCGQVADSLAPMPAIPWPHCGFGDLATHPSLQRPARIPPISCCQVHAAGGPGFLPRDGSSVTRWLSVRSTRPWLAELVSEVSGSCWSSSTSRPSPPFTNAEKQPRKAVEGGTTLAPPSIHSLGLLLLRFLLLPDRRRHRATACGRIGKKFVGIGQEQISFQCRLHPWRGRQVDV